MGRTEYRSFGRSDSHVLIKFCGMREKAAQGWAEQGSEATEKGKQSKAAYAPSERIQQVPNHSLDAFVGGLAVSMAGDV